jgi:hypothetical protein
MNDPSTTPADIRSFVATARRAASLQVAGGESYVLLSHQNSVETRRCLVARAVIRDGRPVLEARVFEGDAETIEGDAEAWGSAGGA